MAKRQRGAQPHNQNARRHGYYSRALGPALRNAYRRAAKLDDSGLVAEIRLARAKVSELMRLEPENHEILRGMLSTMTRMIAINHNLDAGEERDLGGALQELLAELLPDRQL